MVFVYMFRVCAVNKVGGKQKNTSYLDSHDIKVNYSATYAKIKYITTVHDLNNRGKGKNKTMSIIY